MKSYLHKYGQQNQKLYFYFQKGMDRQEADVWQEMKTYLKVITSFFPFI